MDNSTLQHLAIINEFLDNLKGTYPAWHFSENDVEFNREMVKRGNEAFRQKEKNLNKK